MGNDDGYDSNVANAAGYAAGNIEGSYDRASNDVQAGWNAVESVPGDIGRRAEQGYDNTVQGIENIPQNIGGALQSAANWIANSPSGEKIGGVQSGYDNAQQDVQRFGDNMSNSYEQGQQEGRNNWGN
ncbi:hypothetical protein K470DRAFT_264951 [Piedraia hortae CBS 480.64]|uniref:Uncharacterized protein n=1 Tax=Piedraia hortae CBS 480.64 TaxID=1314780 RepID=A0A6A7BX68_9PEZI|nr:hypothetical protein K470DRAFT_264951 [Piedraia hortae CBS 480.64]